MVVSSSLIIAFCSENIILVVEVEDEEGEKNFGAISAGSMDPEGQELVVEHGEVHPHLLPQSEGKDR